MDLETIQSIARISGNLSKLKGELERYYEEDYLYDLENHTPWITVKISNHPTYLKDFTVDMNDDDLRDSIVKLTIQQIKKSIKKLEKKLAELLK